MRVREFLAFMGRIKGLTRSEVPLAVDAACARLALEQVVDRQVGTLSKGFRQRVAIAQALLGRPEVLILDEPSNGLDPTQIIEMRELIRSLAGSLTILVTSHILAEMERMADRVAILVQGRLLAVRPLRSAGAASRLRLRVRGDEARVRACLGQVPGVHTVALAAPSQGGVAAYRIDVDGPSVAEPIAAVLVQGGFGILTIDEDTVDLEALFLELTGRAAAAPSPAVA
jgi:ABC-2 type transport system ATP-binding protein